MEDYLHNDPEFEELLNITAAAMGINVALVEKDYWIMQTLFGLKMLPDSTRRKTFEQRYLESASLYYRGQPSFSEILETIAHWLPKL